MAISKLSTLVKKRKELNGDNLVSQLMWLCTLFHGYKVEDFLRMPRRKLKLFLDFYYNEYIPTMNKGVKR